MTGPARASVLEGIDGLVHGFERRGSTPETRDEGRRRLTAALAPAGRLLLLRQVHGTTIHRGPWEGTPEGDGGVAAPGLLVGIETADCLPVLVADVKRRVVGAAHAGWRGTAAGIANRLVETLIADGSSAADLRAALGPSIGGCCYEVGEDVRQAFGSAGDGVFRDGPRGRPHLDLHRANTLQLLAAGLEPSALEAIDECTRCRADLYYSYRRDGAGTGRMVSYVGFSG